MSVVLSGTVVRVRVLQPVLGASEAFTEQTGNILPTKIEKKPLWLITDPNETEHRLCWKLHPSVLMLHSVANGNFYSWSKVGFWWTVHSLTVVLLCIWVQNLVISDLNYPPPPPSNCAYPFSLWRRETVGDSANNVVLKSRKLLSAATLCNSIMIWLHHQKKLLELENLTEETTSA